MPGRNVLAVALIGAISLFCWQATQGAKPKDEMLELYGLFVDAVEKVEANYVRPVSRRELLESALEGMLQNLDQHSSFINTSEWKQFRKQIEGKFGGIGIQVGVDPETGRLRVIAPMVGTPAYEAGVLAGDQIMEIDGTLDRGDGPRQGRRRPDRPAGHRRQADRPARGDRAARDGLHHPGHHRGSQRAGRPPGPERPVGLHDRQGQEDRLRADLQLHPEHGRRAAEGPRPAQGRGSEGPDPRPARRPRRPAQRGGRDLRPVPGRRGRSSAPRGETPSPSRTWPRRTARSRTCPWSC